MGKTMIVIGAILFAIFFGCVQPVEKVIMDYNVSECTKDETPRVSIEKTSKSLHITQIESYVCCANITITMNTSGKTIRIYEENIGEICRCICPFRTDINLYNADGYENIEIYGIKFRDVYGYELKHNISIKD